MGNDATTHLKVCTGWQVRALEDAAGAVRAQASAHRCGLAVAAATALRAAQRDRDDRRGLSISADAEGDASTTAAAAAAAASAASAAAGLTFRVLGKRSGAGHSGFSSDDLKRACAAALLLTNEDDQQRDHSRDVASAGAGDGASATAASACRLRRVDAPQLVASNGASTNGATRPGKAASNTLGATSADLHFLARVHDTSFSLALLLHDGTLNKSPVNPAPRKAKPAVAKTKTTGD